MISENLNSTSDASTVIPSYKLTQGRLSTSVSDTVHGTGERTATDPYYFRGTISEDVLHRYLDRALTMQNLSMVGGLGGPNTVYYDPINQLPIDAEPALYNTAYEHGQDLAMISILRPKLVQAMLFIWNNPSDWLLKYTCRTLQYDIKFIKNIDSDIICHAALSESIPYTNIYPPATNEWSTNRVLLPMDVDLVKMFYTDEGLTRTVHDGVCYETEFRRGSYGVDYTTVARTVHGNPLFFDFENMRYLPDPVDGSYPDAISYNPTDTAFYLDITRPESQMWVYYLAKRYIDAGCESLHMGDIFMNLRRDSLKGNEKYWGLLQKIREYGRTKCARGLVLLEAHSIYYEGLNDVYFVDGYTPGMHFDKWDAHLLHDYEIGSLYYSTHVGGYSAVLCPTTGGLKPSPCDDVHYGNMYLPATIEPYTGSIRKSWVGYNINGWHTAHNPYISAFDNAKINEGAGCCYPVPTFLGNLGDIWGYDVTSWYVGQKDAYRNSIIAYSHFQFKSLDPFGHFLLPGRLVYSNPTSAGGASYYTALSSGGNTQLPVLVDTWSGIPATYPNWVYHNFDYENVVNNDIQPKSDLVFATDSRIYFIGTNNYIHGYIKEHDNFLGGAWLTVSPSYASGTLIQAKGAL